MPPSSLQGCIYGVFSGRHPLRTRLDDAILRWRETGAFPHCPERGHGLGFGVSANGIFTSLESSTLKNKTGSRDRLKHLTWLTCLLLFVVASASASDRQRQREQFIAAEKALQRHDLPAYRKLRDQLEDYPLLPYLELKALRARLGKASDKEIRRFLAEHAGTPVADLLRRRWLDYLAGKKQWRRYLSFYRPQSSVRRQCHHLQALLATGQKEAVWPEVRRLWLHGRSRPKACDPVFKAWEAAGRRTRELTWQRIELAMHAGRLRLARYLGKKLGKEDRAWVDRWIALYRKPQKAREQAAFHNPHPWREAMLAHAVQRLARQDGLAAIALWQSIQGRYPFSEEQIYQTRRRIAVALERNPDPAAYRWVLSVTPRADDSRLYSARLNAALLRQDWQQLVKDLPNWPEQERRSERWRYWFARALEGVGQEAEAKKLFHRLARERSYYGFLAADRIDAQYHLLHRRTPVDPALLAALEKRPGIVRALELHALQRNTEARREWRYATRSLDKPSLKAAALIAERSGWHDQAIFTLAKTGYWDDLELRFPLQHRELVAAQASKNALDMAWVYAVIRQESAFMKDARSRVGALGLMQLMPATARQVARHQLAIKPPPRRQLLEPSVNIRLGSAYLRELKERLADNPVLATAAYNAGPQRVDRWLPEDGLDADIWVELIPFNETRSYLRRVMSYTVIYDKRLGREPRRLKERMKPVTRTNDQRLAGA
ncbi:MAG: murein transglycosylase [Gammaproteobacteria bacterium]|nr:MAG: murein transglycosylase [Gammaproteobacteria bacterium]